MIVYNVARQWFVEKAAAETYRKSLGLKPDATVKIVVTGREDLAALLNALCEPQAVIPAGGYQGDLKTVVDRAYVEPTKELPLCFPLFLIKDPEQRARQQARLHDLSIRGELDRALKED